VSSNARRTVVNDRYRSLYMLTISSFISTATYKSDMSHFLDLVLVQTCRTAKVILLRVGMVHHKPRTSGPEARTATMFKKPFCDFLVLVLVNDRVASSCVSSWQFQHH
jgi:hypothetical protein